MKQTNKLGKFNILKRKYFFLLHVINIKLRMHFTYFKFKILSTTVNSKQSNGSYYTKVFFVT